MEQRQRLGWRLGLGLSTQETPFRHRAVEVPAHRKRLGRLVSVPAEIPEAWLVGEGERGC